MKIVVLKGKGFFLVYAVILVIAAIGVMPPVPAQPTAGMFQVDINHHPTVDFWGVPMDSEWDTPGWHIRAAIAHLLDKADFLSTIFVSTDQIIDNPVPKTTALSSWYLDWTAILMASWPPVDPLHTLIGLYNSVPGPDIYEARDHLVAAGGTGNDGSPWHDYDNDGRIDNPPTQLPPIVFYYADWDTTNRRRSLAEYLEYWIEYVFNGANVVELRPISFSGWLGIVFDTSVPDDWHLFTSGWRVPDAPPPNWLYDLYQTNGDFNYIFYSNPFYDLITKPLSLTEAHWAQYHFGVTIGTIPVWWEP